MPLESERFALSTIREKLRVCYRSNRSCSSLHAVIRVYDVAGNGIQTHEHAGELLKRGRLPKSARDSFKFKKRCQYLIGAHFTIT
jgi:hypothetical protein